MSAPFANVLVVTFARGHRGVLMLAKETGQSMGDARSTVAPIKYRSATASAGRASTLRDYCVMDLVAKERACA
ncbi:MAG TPA: hypothetical protein VEW46_20075 [Pyrinomonadaceae bacterium]|nr:hypothetical protein [Pyrinomonadaceae bacterium]